MNIFWLLRARRWVQNPPSLRTVIAVLAVVAVCLALAAVEFWIGWPEWLTTNGIGGGRWGPRF